jgi:3-oxoadipate enol-lactonase
MTAVDLAWSVHGADHLPTVVLTGSLGSTTQMWEPQLQALSERFRVVAVDTRGHGRSPVPPPPYDVDDLAADLDRVLDRLGVERAHAVGLSLGGLGVLQLAATRPHRLDRVVVLCTSARFTPSEAWAERARLVEADGLPSIASAVVARWFTAEHAQADPALVAWAESMLCSIDPVAYAACCRLLVQADLRDRLPDIRAPLLAIAGADDPATPPPHLQAIVDGVPGARLAVVDDAAHLANLDQPEAVNALVLDHLTGGTAPEGA